MKSIKYLFIPIIFLTASLCSIAQTVTLDIKNIRSQKGQLQISVFENQSQFDDEKPFKSIYFDKSGISSGNKRVVINLPPGTYGLSILDDEDNSKDMTYRLGIYPREGVGFTGYKLSGMSKPKFSDFDFTINQGDKVLVVDMKYF